MNEQSASMTTETVSDPVFIAVFIEVLIKSLADWSQALAKDYEDFLAAQQWLPIADADFDRATRLRAVHKLKTPDALHLATAIRHSCIEFWTNDDCLNSVAVGMAVNIFTVETA